MTTVEAIDNSLNILEPISQDNSIESEQFIDYTPQNQANLNARGNPILIEINASDDFLNISKSYLVIEGQLVKSDNGNAYAANEEIALVNNSMMHLFSAITYSMGGTIMERITDPGQITSMLTYASQPDDYSTSAALMSCWSKDTTNHASSGKFTASVAAPAAGYTPAENPNYNQGFAARRGLLMSADPRGTFSFVIPFSHIFGFSGYDKLIYNMKHSLAFTRHGSDNQAIYRANGVADGKIQLTTIMWRVPCTKPETSKLMELRNIIETKQIIPLAFSARNSEYTSVPRSRELQWRTNVLTGIEKPRWIMVGFQTDRKETQEQNPAIFDHVNLTNAYVTLNKERYPQYDIITDFPSNKYSTLYKMFDSFKKEYYGFNSLIGGTQVSFPAFKSLFPIIIFDVSRQSEKLKLGIVDMQIKFTFSEVVPANTTAYALILSDRLYYLKSDGKNLTLVQS
jgi:hypothetical protein